MSSRGGWESQLVGTILGLCLVVFIVLVLIAGYLLVRAVNLVLRVLARYPRASRPLWVCLAVLVVCLGAAIVTQVPVLFALSGVAFLVAVLVARAIELGQSQVFEEQGGFQVLSHDVLHDWWQEVA